MFAVVAFTCLGLFGAWDVSVHGAAPPYETIGCFQDAVNRAIPTLEGLDPVLDGSYRYRQDPINKCYQAAKKRNFHVFAVQNGGWCASSFFAAHTFDRYGDSSACRADGKGGDLVNQVYVIKEFNDVGCFRDGLSRAIPTLEGTDPILDGTYWTRVNPIAKCAAAAMRQGYSMFAVQDGGRCVSSADAPKTYSKYGDSGACLAGGEDGDMASQVYEIEGLKRPYETVGCFGDSSDRAITALDGFHPLLKDNYLTREGAITKCYQVALDKGFDMFAIQDGGWCAGDKTAAQTFDKYGESDKCKADGKGGPYANQVYVIKARYEAVGCYTEDTVNRAIKTLEDLDPVLDGGSKGAQTRENPISKCAVAAMRRGYKIFALQDGGLCAASATAENTYKKYGRSNACLGGGGGPIANDVYAIIRQCPHL